jgi:rod shape-determining protein MreD
MTRVFAYFLAGLGFLLLQSALLPRILPFETKPDLLLILIVYLGLHERYLQGAGLSYLLGCFFDVFAGSSPGLYGTAFLGTFLAVRGVASQLNTESSVLLLFMVFCGTLFHGGILIFPLGFFADAGPLWSIILGHLLSQVLLNLTTAYLLIMGITRLQKRFFPRTRIPGLQRLDSRYEY